jgi:hypothetical protein
MLTFLHSSLPFLMCCNIYILCSPGCLHSFAIVDLTDDDSHFTASDTFGKLFKALGDHGVELPVNITVHGPRAFEHIFARIQRGLPIDQLHHCFHQAANNTRNFFVNNAEKCSRALVFKEGQVHDVIVLHSSLTPNEQNISTRSVMDTRNDAATHKVTIIGQSRAAVLAKVMYEVVLENGVHLFVPLHAVSSHYSNGRSLIQTPYVVKSGEPTSIQGCAAPRLVFKVEGRCYQENEVTITGTTSAVYEVNACDIECPAIVFVRIPENDPLLYTKVKLITNYCLGVQCKLSTCCGTLAVSLTTVFTNYPLYSHVSSFMFQLKSL